VRHDGACRPGTPKDHGCEDARGRWQTSTSSVGGRVCSPRPRSCY
jgi:hypothetical protein